jgi:hypothetical protein
MGNIMKRVEMLNKKITNKLGADLTTLAGTGGQL